LFDVIYEGRIIYGIIYLIRVKGGFLMRKYIKRLILLTMIIVLILSLNLLTYADDEQFFIVIDGVPVEFDSVMGYPILTETERTLVPIRIIAENMGYTVDWNQSKNRLI